MTGTGRGWAQLANVDFYARVGVNRIKEIVAFVINHDEGRKILNFNFPYGFHAEFCILKHFDLGDAVLCESSSRATDRSKVKTAVGIACIGNLS